MSTTAKSRLRKLLVLAASMVGLLAWAAAAAAAAGDGGGPGSQGGPAKIEPSARPDSGEPRGAASRGDQPELLTPSTALLLPDTWEKADDLMQAAIELNSRLAQALRSDKLVPWDLADQIRRSLSAGKALGAKLPAEGPTAYYQALYMAALAAGYPDDAMFAARELTKLDPKQGWNWISLYQAGTLMGDKAACTEAVGKIEQLVGQPEIVAAMKAEADPIGRTPDCQLDLSDKTTLNPAKLPGKVLVVDFWMYTDRLSGESRPYARYAYDMFKCYPAFRMVGVNMDDLKYKSLATGFAGAHNMDWPSHFEGHGDRPISLKIFGVHRLPAAAVISPLGQVIFCGRPTSNPIFFYAIRAGLVQANKGHVPASQPSTGAEDDPAHSKSSLPSGGGSGKGDVAGAGDTKPTPAPAAPDKAKQEKDATEQLKMAEAFLAAGARDRAIEIYKEVARKYPDTAAGTKASVELLTLEP